MGLEYTLYSSILFKLGVNTALNVPLDSGCTPCAGVRLTVFRLNTVSFTYGVRVKVWLGTVFSAPVVPTEALRL